MSHAGFLREEWTGEDQDFLETTRQFKAAAQAIASMSPADAVARLADVVQALPLSEVDRAMVNFSGALTLRPGATNARQLETLRTHGFDDDAIHAVVLITSCFAFMNRLADGTGVTVGPEYYDLAVELFGPDALEAHLEWSKGITDPTASE